MLRLDLKIGQSVDLPGVGRITVEEKTGRRVRLGFDVSREQKVVLALNEGRPEDDVLR